MCKKPLKGPNGKFLSKAQIKELQKSSKKPKAEAKPAPEAAPAEPAESKHRGRPPSEATVKLRERILALSAAPDGVTNKALSTHLELTTLQTQFLCKPLVKSGLLELIKGESGRLRYVARG